MKDRLCIKCGGEIDGDKDDCCEECFRWLMEEAWAAAGQYLEHEKRKRLEEKESRPVWGEREVERLFGLHPGALGGKMEV